MTGHAAGEPPETGGRGGAGGEEQPPATRATAEDTASDLPDVVHRARPRGATPASNTSPGGCGPGARRVSPTPPRLPAVPHAPRRGLVLGGGGLLGASWAIGALCALEDALVWDARTAELIVGTSAGAVVGSVLGAGVTPGQLNDHQRGVPATSGPLLGVGFDYDSAAGGALPPAPHIGIGSPAMLRHTVRHPRRYPTSTVLSAFLPQGRGSVAPLGQLVGALAPVSERWSPHSGLRVVTVDYGTGYRVAFGDPEEPQAGVAEAVQASCAIPGWFAPVTIGERRYVDGGTWSATNVDMLMGAGLDEVYVLAPMASRVLDRPRGVLARMERRFRRAVTRQLLREATVLRSTGTRVRLLGPGPQDLKVMGSNMMDPTRRVASLEMSLRTSAQALAWDRHGPFPA